MTSTYALGQLVLGKVCGYKWWPGIVTGLPGSDSDYLDCYRIDFLSDYQYSFLKLNKIRAYNCGNMPKLTRATSKFNRAFHLADQILAGALVYDLDKSNSFLNKKRSNNKNLKLCSSKSEESQVKKHHILTETNLIDGDNIVDSNQEAFTDYGNICSNPIQNPFAPKSKSIDETGKEKINDKNICYWEYHVFSPLVLKNEQYNNDRSIQFNCNDNLSRTLHNCKKPLECSSISTSNDHNAGLGLSREQSNKCVNFCEANVEEANLKSETAKKSCSIFQLLNRDLCEMLSHLSEVIYKRSKPNNKVLNASLQGICFMTSLETLNNSIPNFTDIIKSFYSLLKQAEPDFIYKNQIQISLTNEEADCLKRLTETLFESDKLNSKIDSDINSRSCLMQHFSSQNPEREQEQKISKRKKQQLNNHYHEVDFSSIADYSSFMNSSKDNSECSSMSNHNHYQQKLNSIFHILRALNLYTRLLPQSINHLKNENEKLKDALNYFPPRTLNSKKYISDMLEIIFVRL